MESEQASIVRELEHIGIIVPDLDKAIEYYSHKNNLADGGSAVLLGHKEPGAILIQTL